MILNLRRPDKPRLLNSLGLIRLVPALLLALLVLQGCGHFRPHASRPYVYVWVKDMYLRNRAAPVNTRVTRVVNGDRLAVLEQDGRFMRVKAPDGRIGWLAQETVIDQPTYDKFADLAKDNAHDPVLSHGILLYSYWLRDAPGRQSDRFYLLQRNTKLELLRRVSIPRPQSPQLLPKNGKGENTSPPSPELEDYWLARAADGHVGWVRGGDLDEDVPQDIAVLCVGHKAMEARVLRTVTDPDSDRPNRQVPEYVVALAPWRQDGLPYDFDQMRVFTWNVRRHRWETAYRDRDLEGYLPVTVTQQAFGHETDPVFSFRVATGNSARIDPKTGMAEAATAATEVYRLEDTVVRKVSGPDVQRGQDTGKKIQPPANRRHRRRR